MKQGWYRKYKYVPVRVDLVRKVKAVVAAEIGYRSVTDFVNDAVRRRLEEVSETYNIPLSSPKPEARPPAEGCEGEEGRPTWGDELRRAGAGGESEPWEPPQHV